MMSIWPEFIIVFVPALVTTCPHSRPRDPMNTDLRIYFPFSISSAIKAATSPRAVTNALYPVAANQSRRLKFEKSFNSHTPVLTRPKPWFSIKGKNTSDFEWRHLEPSEEGKDGNQYASSPHGPQPEFC